MTFTKANLGRGILEYIFICLPACVKHQCTFYD